MTGFGSILGLYARKALAYRWIVMVPTVLVFALVTFYLMIQPDVYESEALLMAPIVRPDSGSASQDARDMQKATLRSASERLLSTRMLLHVIDEVDPYPELREEKGAEAALEMLRRKLRIEVNNRSNVITVQCSHSLGQHPAEMAAKIVNSLTQEFIQVQRDAIRNKVSFQKQFLDTEKIRLRTLLDQSQARYDAFKAKHAGELPDDVTANKEEIDRLNRQIIDHRMTKRNYQFQVDALNRELKQLDTELMLAAEGGDSSRTSSVGTSKRMLQSLRLELKLLENKYEAGNPKIEAKKAEIEAVEQQIEEERSNVGDDRGRKSREEYIRYVMDYNRKLIHSFQAEIVNLDKQVTKAQQRVEAAHRRNLTAATLEGTTLSLQRDLGDSEKKYEAILMRHAQALERSNYDKYQGTAPIQVEQSAFVPSKPASPDRLLTSLIGLVLGLGIGVGLAVALGRMDPSYQRPEELRSLLPGAVLVTIPEVRAGGARAGRAIMGVLGGLLLIGIFCATLAVLGIQAGWWGEPEMIRVLTNLR